MRAIGFSIVLLGALGASSCAYSEDYDISILRQLESLRSQLNEVRGMLEEQAHEIALLKEERFQSPESISSGEEGKREQFPDQDD